MSALDSIVEVHGHILSRVGPLVLTVTWPDDVSDAQVDAFIQHALQQKRTGLATVSLTQNLGSPYNTRQRQRVGKLMEDAAFKPKRIGLITDSVIARGAVTALGRVIGVPSSAFAPSDVARALAWLSEGDAFDTSAALAAYQACIDLGMRRRKGR
jgi:hypothetical protein